MFISMLEIAIMDNFLRIFVVVRIVLCDVLLLFGEFLVFKKMRVKVFVVMISLII